MPILLLRTALICVTLLFGMISVMPNDTRAQSTTTEDNQTADNQEVKAEKKLVPEEEEEVPPSCLDTGDCVKAGTEDSEPVTK